MTMQKIQEASNFIKSKMQNTPKIGVVLGSGLGVFVDQIESPLIIPYEEIPHFHQTTIVGHEGKLILGKVNNVDVAVFQGRFHLYEGHDIADVVLPVRVLSQLGTEFLILTNASGGINSHYKPGDLVTIKDHINLTGKNPLIGPNLDKLGERFPDMTQTYNKNLQNLIKESAISIGLEAKDGVYAGLLGPTYETPAEIKMLRTLGADMVGMSTVVETIAAHHAKLKVCGISCITNLAAGMGDEKLDHADVKDVANKSKDNFCNLLKETISRMDQL